MTFHPDLDCWCTVERGADPECPHHGMCAHAGHPTDEGGYCHCGMVTG